MTYGYLLMSWMLLSTTVAPPSPEALPTIPGALAEVCARAETISRMAPCTRRDGCEAADRWQEQLGGEPGLRVLTPYGPPEPDPRPAQVPRLWPGALCPLGR